MSWWECPAALLACHLLAELVVGADQVVDGDLDDAVSGEDAEEILNLMAEVLNEVWQAPARARKLAESREAKKTTGRGSTQ